MDAMPIRMVCEHCRSEEVTRDAWVEWDAAAQQWVLGTVFDYAYCHQCQGSTRVEPIVREGPQPVRKGRRLVSARRLGERAVKAVLHARRLRWCGPADLPSSRSGLPDTGRPVSTGFPISLASRAVPAILPHAAAQAARTGGAI